MFLTKKVPTLSKKEINQHFILAKDNISKRALKILHRNGDFFEPQNFLNFVRELL